MHYIFNIGDDNIIYDQSGNGNHGTIQGPSWEEIIYGCMDSNSCNYNEMAIINDTDSCDYSCSIDGELAMSFDGNYYLNTSLYRSDYPGGFTIEGYYRSPDGCVGSGHRAIFGSSGSSFFIGRDYLDCDLIVKDGNTTHGTNGGMEYVWNEEWNHI